MNIAITTFILAVFLLPGLLFRRFYYTEEFSKQYYRNNFFELFFSTLIPSIIFHIIWYYFIKIFNYHVNLLIIGDLLVSENIPNVFQNINKYASQIFLYNISLFGFSCLVGFFGKKIIRFFIFDRKYKMFRFKNSWHYLFSGEFFDFPRASFDITDKVDEIELFYVDFITDTSEGTIIYEGFLVDYELTPYGKLDYIIVKDVERHFLKEDLPIVDNYKIPGHVLIVPFQSIININLTFYKLDIEINQEREIVIEPILIE